MFSNINNNTRFNEGISKKENNMAIVKTIKTVGNLGAQIPFVQTPEEMTHIKDQYINTGKLIIEAPTRTLDENGNIISNTRKHIFVDEAALTEYTNDPVVIAMKARAEETYSAIGAVTSFF